MAIAILGAGIFAKEAHLPAIQKLTGSIPELKAVYSHSERSATELASLAATTLQLASPPSIYHDSNPSANLDVLLARDDITAVIVVLPILVQPAVILKALAAGKHVISEKPVAKDIKSGLELIAEYEAKYKPKGLLWRVAENFEAEPGFLVVADAIRKGRIGKVQQFHARVINFVDAESKWYNTAWRNVPEYQGGFILDGGVHTTAALRTILPSPMTHLSAFASLNKEMLGPHDTVHAIVKSGDGAHGIVDMTWGHPVQARPNSDAFLFTGEKGWISVNQVSDPTTKSPILQIRINSKEGGETVIDEPSKGVEAELASFFSKIKGEETLDIGHPLEALKDVAFVQAALGSGGALVDLEALLASG